MENLTRFVIIRHCQTEMNAKDQYQGIRFEYPLTEVGIDQANKLGQILNEYFANNPLDEIIVSPTLRAQQTASIVSGGIESMKVDRRINPFDLGEADGKTKEEMFTILGFPIFARKKENFAKYLRRIREFLSDTIKQYKGQTVLIVTHKDITGIIDSYLDNTFLLKAPSLGLENGEARIYEFSPTESQLYKLNNKHNFGKLNVNKIEYLSEDFDKQK